MGYRPGTPQHITSVVVGDKVFHGVICPRSFSSMEDNANALAVMRELDKLDRLDAVDFAAIDRLNGLVLRISEPLPDDEHTAWFFSHLIAGFSGYGPLLAANVLSLFGFGSVDDIYHLISKESMSAYHEFTK